MTRAAALAALLLGWTSWPATAATAARQAATEPTPREAPPAVFHSDSPHRAAADRSQLVLAEPRLPDGARHPLPALTESERRSLESDDRSPGARRKRGRVKVGLTRTLPESVGFDELPAVLAPGESRLVGGGLLERGADGRLTWTSAFSSEGAGGLRLHFADARWPAGARAYVYGGNEVHGPYVLDHGTRPEGFWTNTVFGPKIVLELQLGTPDAAELARTRLRIDSLVHLEHPTFAPSTTPPAAPTPSSLRPKSDACFVDATCVATSEFANIASLSNAAAQLNFTDAGQAFICSGGLLAATNGASVPYLLTANHCFDNQASATSLEAFFQFKTSSCNGPAPAEELFPSTLGSTLLATGKQSDFTFVQLSENPPDGSVFLGWTTDDVSSAGGTILHRLSYPDARPQIYTREQVDASPGVVCQDALPGNFIYEKDVHGGTGGGSSGSLLSTPDLHVVGQELGACGNNTMDDCDTVSNWTLDGAFRVTFPSVQQWLSPSSPGPCVPNSTTLCLSGGRFRTTVAWATSSGTHGAGTAIPLTSDSGYFWFFNSANVELVVKVLNACPLNSRFWVFAGGLTNVDVTLNVQDTQTGTIRTYHNTLGTPFAPLQDTSAFVCP
jgi:hypothetical protein